MMTVRRCNKPDVMGLSADLQLKAGWLLFSSATGGYYFSPSGCMISVQR